MPKKRKIPKTLNGTCHKRNLSVKGFQICDFFERKCKRRYKACCRNCTHFVIDSKDDKPTSIKQDSK